MRARVIYGRLRASRGVPKIDTALANESERGADQIRVVVPAKITWEMMARIVDLSNHLKTIKGSETKLIGSGVAVPPVRETAKLVSGGKDVSP